MQNNLLAKIIKLSIRPVIILLGLMCLWYFIALANFKGHINTFSIIWIFIGVFLILIAIIIKKIPVIFAKLNKVIKMILIGLLILFTLSFLIIQSLLIINSRSNNMENADYIIVLGAGLYRGGPSITLQRRINEAINYANDHPEVKIVASGGTGQGMSISEARVISNVMQRNGIESSRIIIEDKSTNTFENLKYSGELIGSLEKKTVIVSSEFHLYRANIIAKRLGYRNVGTLASKSEPLLLLNYYLREYMAVIKTLIFDNVPQQGES